MTVFALDRPWVPLNGKHYGKVVLVPHLDTFMRDNPYYWGVCNAYDLTYTTTIDWLQIVGDRNWHPRFDLMDSNDPHVLPGVPTTDWQHALFNLAGVHASNAKLHIKHLDVVGLPGSGINLVGCPAVTIDSAYFDRVCWPIQVETFLPSTKLRFGRVATRDHWFGRAWTNGQYISADARTVSMRRLDEKVAGRGEIVMTGMGWEIDGVTHMGDGIGYKVCGSRWNLRNAQVQAAFFAGVVPYNLTNPAYSDPKFQFLKETVGCVAEDCLFGDGPFDRQQKEAIVYVSYPFQPEPLILRRCVFTRGWRTAALQINWAHVVLDDCDLIGWPTWDAAFQLSPAAADGSMPAGTVDTSTSRIWAS